MITFNVVKQKHGWAICVGDCTTTHFWSRERAIREARSLADALRCHGARAEVIIVTAEAGESSPAVSDFVGSHIGAQPQGMQARSE